MKLRDSVKLEFIKALDDSYFTSRDFLVEFWDQLNATELCKIKFLHDERYTFVVYFSKSMMLSNVMYSVKYSPGAFEMVDSPLPFEKFDRIFELIDKWIGYINTELSAISMLSKGYEKVDLDIEKYFSFEDEGDDIFSVSEINELKAKFARLESRLVELEEEHFITKNQLDEILRTIGEVDQDINNFPKRVWTKTSINKITKAIVSIAKTKEGRSLLAKGAGKLLGLD